MTAEPAAGGSRAVAIRIQSDSSFELQTYFQGGKRTFAVKAGEQEFDISGTPEK
jgi:hypothetical protein